MKIEYTDEEARQIEQAYFQLPRGRRREAVAVRAAFVAGLKMCGVKCLHCDEARISALRVWPTKTEPEQEKEKE